MDLAPSRHYVAGAMELLLAFLSLLTAATGALTGARAPEAGVHQAVQVGVAQRAAPRVAQAQRPAAIAVSLPEQRTDAAQLPVAPVRAIPLYANRPIE